MKLKLSNFSILLILITSTGAFADNIFSDNFDFGQSVQTPLGTGVVDPYFQNDSSVYQSTFAVFGSPNNGSVPGCPAPESGNCLNLAGDYDVSQIVTRSPISIGPGDYELTFTYAGSQRAQDLNALDSGQASFGNLFSKGFSIAPNGGPETFDLKFSTNSAITANLVFTDTTPRPANDDFYDGVLIDSIQMSTATATVTPEPGSMALSSIAGVLLLAGLLRRRTAKAHLR